jgi:hypothetical protein
MGLVFPGEVLAVVHPGAAAGADEGAVKQDEDPALPGVFFNARSRRGARAESRLITSSAQRRTVEAETSLPPAMSASRLMFPAG